MQAERVHHWAAAQLTWDAFVCMFVHCHHRYMNRSRFNFMLVLLAWHDHRARQMGTLVNPTKAVK